MNTCEDCGGALLGGPHEPWCMNAPNAVPVPRFLRPRIPAGAVCEVCQRRARNCECPDGPELG